MKSQLVLMVERESVDDASYVTDQVKMNNESRLARHLATIFS